MPYRVTERGEQRRAAMRARLLTAARPLFARQGFHATTMQQVVREASTSIGNLYFYFPTKEALLRAVVEQAHAAAERAIDTAVAQAPAGPAQLAIAICTGISALLAQADLARVVYVDAAQAGLRDDAISYFAARVQRFMEANPALLGGASPEIVAQAWQGAIFYVMQRALTSGEQPDAAVLGRFLARWNMQALGLPPGVVEQALRAVDAEGTIGNGGVWSQ